MSNGYDPPTLELGKYDWWLHNGFFEPQLASDGRCSSKGVFVVPLPPPTVNGGLHLGHALTVTIEDVLSRWNRMLGKTTLFIPGFDHGGISTEVVVEKRLYRRTGQTRHDLGKEKFLHAIHDWNDEQQRRITDQLRRLGCSCDWTRKAWTMDEKLSTAVVEAFCRLHEHGIIYRDRRLVNWCVKLNTTLSNLELEQKQLHGRTAMTVPGYPPNEKFDFGVITSFAYQVESSEEKIVVSTTRPETMLADTAIAVHPDDTRYQHLHGKFVNHPFVKRRIPIIADDTVDMASGTGAVKISPAHETYDFEVGRRHNLQFISILNEDGTLNCNAGEKFKGLKRFHARVVLVEALKDVGLHIETKDFPMQLSVCQKSGDIVEPMLKSQWWVNCKPLADAAIKRTRAGEVTLNSDQTKAGWYRWLENVQDWCISRQLWWGHQCPAYFVHIEGKDQDTNDCQNWVVGRTFDEAMERAKVLAGNNAFTLEQDGDVLDAWFSAALWPLSIMGWPNNTADMRNFYPLSILETGRDTIYSWVARMTLVCIYFTGIMPFKEVFCHAMVRDSYGRKMGKSLGNGVDPVDFIEGSTLGALNEKLSQWTLDDQQLAKAMAGQEKEYPDGVPQCGTDALRFTLCAYSSGCLDINIEISRVETYRRFCTKIFDATLSFLQGIQDHFVPSLTAKPTGQESLIERWILHKLNVASSEVNKQLVDRNFQAATTAAYDFWYDLCDVYIEAIKPTTTNGVVSPTTRKSAQQTLYTCFDCGLKLLHPFMPFVTEELWQRLPRRPNDTTPSIMVSSFPTFDPAFVFEVDYGDFELVFSAIRAGQTLTTPHSTQSGINLIVYLYAPKDHEANVFQSQVSTIVTLTKGCKAAKVIRDIKDVPKGCHSAIVTGTLSVYACVQSVVDLNVEFAKTLDKIRNLDYEEIVPTNVPTNVLLINEYKDIGTQSQSLGIVQ